jgi:hypothetical protein
MPDPQTTGPQRLYVVSGSMHSGLRLEICPGVLLATSEAEAIGLHVKWMQDKFPGIVRGPVDAFLVPMELIRKAANAQP